MNKMNMKTIACIALTVLYFIGLICLIFKQTALGLFLWMISIVGGMGVLYYLRQQKKAAEEKKRMEEESEGKEDR